MTETNTATRIRELNDRFRCSLGGDQQAPRDAGCVLLTPGITSLPEELRTEALLRVATFNEFSEDNDPFGEHDFGSFTLEGRRIMWKIDYYDATMDFGSPDPTDPGVTTRVLTILLAEEY